VQKKSHTLKISGGQALMASTVALTRLGFPMVSFGVMKNEEEGSLESTLAFVHLARRGEAL
jgi:hypothetical protein